MNEMATVSIFTAKIKISILKQYIHSLSLETMKRKKQDAGKEETE